MGKRRAYIRVPDRILREQWDDATLADIIRLQAFLNTRWARDGLTAEEAGRCELGPQEMMLVTRTTNVSRARGRLLALQQRTGGVTLAVREASQGRYKTVIVEWPKFSIEQGYYDREEPNLGRDKSPPPPPPPPPPLTATKKGNETPASQARSVWPRLVSRANRHGGKWAQTPGPKQVEIIAARIKEGATASDLERAIEGYIRRNGTEERDGFNPMAHFTATTIFRTSKFAANVEGSNLKPRDNQKKPKGPAYDVWKGFDAAEA